MRAAKAGVNLLIVTTGLILLSSCETVADSSPDEPAAPVPARVDALRERVGTAVRRIEAEDYAGALSILDDVITTIETDQLVDPMSETARNAYVQRGRAHAGLGRFEASSTDFGRALVIQQEYLPESLVVERELYATRANSEGMAGRLITAMELFEEAVAKNRQSDEPDPMFASQMHRALSQVARELNDREREIAELRNAIQAVGTPGDDQQIYYVSGLQLELSDALRVVNRWEEAIEPANRAIEGYQQIDGPPNLIGTAYYFRALAESRSTGELSARQSYVRAIEQFERSPNPNIEFLGVASYNLARTFRQSDDTGLARVYFTKARDAYATRLDQLEAQNRRAPGSVPQNLLDSYRSRLADARNALQALAEAQDE